MKSPILGQSYVARSVNAACDRLINLYPEPTSEGKDAGFLTRCPGLKLVYYIEGGAAIRGMITVDNFLYVVSGNYLYRVDPNPDMPSVQLGSIFGTDLVSMADNGKLICIVTGEFGYVFNTDTQELNAISGFPGGETVVFLSSYFVFNPPNTQLIYTFDGDTIDPLSFASAEGAPDNIVALAANNKELWVYGSNSIEVWYDAGTPDFPLAPIQGAFIENGCAAVFSVAKLDNSLFWLGADLRGRGIVYRTNGYSAQRVSTFAIEFAIQSYSRIDDAVAFSYQQDGHSFYVLTFPTGNTTWVYDVSTSAWHQRGAFVNGAFREIDPLCCTQFNGMPILGTHNYPGILFTYDLNFYTDFNSSMVWLRLWRALPPGENNLDRSAHHELQLDCETGVGINDESGSNPMVMLRWSDDGGHTWSNEHWAAMGKIGQFSTRVIWRRLGMTTKLRDRVYEISGSSPVKIAIIGAELKISGTSS